MTPNFHKHALRCGIDMSGREAVPISMAAERIAAVDVIHPETQESVIPEGFKVTKLGVQYLRSIGCDYVVCEK